MSSLNEIGAVLKNVLSNIRFCTFTTSPFRMITIEVAVANLKKLELKRGTALKNKTDLEFAIEEDHMNWLEENVAEYSLEDESKALRVLIDYAMEEVDPEHIFASENMRCKHCG